MWYWIFRLSSIALLKLFFRLKVEGLEHLPQKSNFIIVANHSSFLDPLVVAAVVPQKIHCIVSRGLFLVGFLRWWLNRLEVIPSGGISHKAIEYLMHNKIVGLFPEGRCSRDGRLKEFRRGAALLSIKTGRPIVPAAIIGAFEALPVEAKFPRFRRIKVKISSPIYLLKEFDEVIDDIYLQEGMQRVKNSIQELINGG